MVGRGGRLLAVVALLGAASGGVHGQETMFKAGVAVSTLSGSGVEFWDERLVAQSFGGHIRFNFGPIALQPEITATTRGAGASAAAELEQMRFEHIEVAALVVLPFRGMTLEPYLFAGPSIILEGRCRHVVGATACAPPSTATHPPARSSVDPHSTGR
jgi:hypothetical protein